MSTYTDVCTAIATHIIAKHGGQVTPSDIFNASPSGELWHIHEMYWKCRNDGMAALDGFEPDPREVFPSAPNLGDIVRLKDGSVHAYMGSGVNGWIPMLPPAPVVAKLSELP